MNTRTTTRLWEPSMRFVKCIAKSSLLGPIIYTNTYCLFSYYSEHRWRLMNTRTMTRLWEPSMRPTNAWPRPRWRMRCYRRRDWQTSKTGWASSKSSYRSEGESSVAIASFKQITQVYRRLLRASWNQTQMYGWCIRALSKPCTGVEVSGSHKLCYINIYRYYL